MAGAVRATRFGDSRWTVPKRAGLRQPGCAKGWSSSDWKLLYDRGYACWQVSIVDPPLFTSSADEEPSFLAFLLQQLFVPLAALLILAVVPGVPWRFVQAGIGGQVIEVSRSVVVSAAAGFLIGLAVRRRLGRAVSGGKWIGVLPSILMIWALLNDAFTFSLAKALAELFFPGPDGEGWWAFALLTCPTISTLSYSVAMAWPLFAQKQVAQQ